MAYYANNFSISVSDSKSEFVLTFRQRVPVVESDGTVSSMNEETLAALILNAEGFEALRSLLNSISTE